jgi:hypothetical protein
MTLQLESVPPGAEAKTSLGPSCRTPCAVSVPQTPSFTVTYTLDRYLPQTVPVQLVEAERSVDPESGTVMEARFDPSPVYVELQPAPPPPRKRAAPKAAPKRTTPPPQAQQQSAPPPAAPQSPVQSRFPPPAQSGFPPPR